MTLTDSRFTAEVVSAHGKTIMFDDVGCLAAWLGQNSAPIASTWVMSFADRRRWIQADSAVYLRVDSIRTPMASSLLALPPGHEADSVQAAIGGIRAIVAERSRGTSRAPSVRPLLMLSLLLALSVGSPPGPSSKIWTVTPGRRLAKPLGRARPCWGWGYHLRRSGRLPRSRTAGHPPRRDPGTRLARVPWRGPSDHSGSPPTA